jgi:pectate lyase
MKKLLYSLGILLFACYILYSLPAFPGAEGFGAETPGGRGGTVLFVTNLNDNGPGSFRQALLTPGKRIIVFRVSGVVQGAGQIFLAAENLSYVTIAGQTSPGGITITTDPGTPIWQYGDVKFHDAIWRFLRFRVVRESGGNGGDHAFEQYRSRNYIIDHCDFSGGDDECLDMCYAHHFTIQWSTICNSGPGGQCYGALFAYTDPPSSPLGHISMHHNLIANHSKRGPEMHWSDKPLPDSGKVDLRNNVIYNITQYGTRVHGVNDTSVLQLTLVGNYWKAGPIGLDFAPVTTFLTVHVYANNNYWTGPSKQNIRADNIMVGDVDTLFRTSYGAGPTLVSTPWDVPAVTTHTPQQAYDTVLARVGAWPRDSMNARTVREVKTATGGLGKCDDPLITSGPAAPADADNDGMPDFWETGMGLDPNSASDNSVDSDGDGYTNTCIPSRATGPIIILHVVNPWLLNWPEFPEAGNLPCPLVPTPGRGAGLPSRHPAGVKSVSSMSGAGRSGSFQQATVLHGTAAIQKVRLPRPVRIWCSGWMGRRWSARKGLLKSIKSRLILEQK